MRALLIAVAGATAASLLGFATASAAPPVTTSIQLHPTTFAPVEAGTWQATGGIDDSGTFTRTDVHNTGSLPDCFCPPEHTGAFSETFLLTGADGTLTVRAEELFTAGGDPFGNVNGVWQIVSGTGAYARASGHGTDYFGPPLTLYLTGEVSKVE